jgi:ATP-dependent protease HslVU (ClpYQ) peptidase subunit
MMDGVVAVVVDEDEVDVVVVAVVAFVVMWESKTQAAMRRLQVVAKGEVEVGVWGEVEVFELMDLYQHQLQQELFEVQ